jgi:hypothetical protein
MQPVTSYKQDKILVVLGGHLILHCNCKCNKTTIIKINVL